MIVWGWLIDGRIHILDTGKTTYNDDSFRLAMAWHQPATGRHLVYPPWFSSVSCLVEHYSRSLKQNCDVWLALRPSVLDQHKTLNLTRTFCVVVPAELTLRAMEYWVLEILNMNTQGIPQGTYPVHPWQVCFFFIFILNCQPNTHTIPPATFCMNIHLPHM